MHGCVNLLLLVANFIPYFSIHGKKLRRFLRDHHGAATLPAASGSHCWLPVIQTGL